MSDTTFPVLSLVRQRARVLLFMDGAAEKGVSDPAAGPDPGGRARAPRGARPPRPQAVAGSAAGLGRWDMKSCSAGGMTWSAVPISDQDGIVCQAGVPEGADPALNAIGRWVAARTAAWLAGRPLAKHCANPG